MQQLIVLSNRAPFSHTRAAGGVVLTTRSASGLVTALEPLLKQHTGTWVAHGSGDADRLVVDRADGLNVPPATSGYRLRYVWLTEEERQRYYGGFANEGLWPLCHAVGVAPVFRARDFETYEAVNSRFVSAVVAEAGDSRPAVLVQDYHFALAPRLLRRQLPSSTVVTFWHIPWPRPHLLRSCPWARQLLDGLLGSNILGFQTDEDCTNFVSCVAEWLDADVGRGDETIAYRGRSTRVRTYPVGVEWDGTIVRTTPPAALCRERICRDLALPFDVRLGVGVDRLDYTKGIPQKFLAIERLLEQHPELRGKFVFVQIAEPSRECLPAYREARRQVLETRDRVNERFAGDGIPPIRLLEGHQEADAVYTLYRAADLCYVGSLRDGMNLVAKEFVNARDDERGVLVLSSRAGAARQLRAALLIDPYDIAAAAAALENALAMPQPEQTRRMRLLRFVVRTCSAQWWAEQLLRDANRESGRPTLPARVPARVQVPA